RAFGRVTGDINPIHLHAVPARVFGFPSAIAHGWWTTGRAAAELGIDEAVPGRRLEIAFRRPIVLPSTPVLCSRAGIAGGVEFALFPTSPGSAGHEPVRALVSGVVTG
ncbi:MAG TPA: MaoC/PaaZ C-terminal domain-containing protein, partial [Motilibacterales bacterium]|nr:MaoC/PaaZ C-terminal domain-containing protein [Motilibacterales bacterium]